LGSFTEWRLLRPRRERAVLVSLLLSPSLLRDPLALLPEAVRLLLADARLLLLAEEVCALLALCPLAEL
jgi:hypothetical protein